MSENESNENIKSPINNTLIGVIIKNPQDTQENPDTTALKSLFKIALETRNFEITQLGQRNNFFMIFQGVLFAGLIQSAHTKPIVSFLVCTVGMLVSFFQIKMAAGAKFWQEYWEEALNKIEKELMKNLHTSTCHRNKLFYLFHDKVHIYEKMVQKRLSNHGTNFIDRLILRRYSVSRIPIYVAMTISCVWFLLILCTLRSYPPLSIPSFIVGF